MMLRAFSGHTSRSFRARAKPAHLAALKRPSCLSSLRAQTSASGGMGQRVVWAWNEFDPLEEVIVGIADGSTVPPNEPGHLSKVWHLPGTVAEMGQPRHPAKIERA